MRAVYCKANVYIPILGYVGRIMYSTITENYFYQLKSDFTPLFRFKSYDDCVKEVEKIYNQCKIVENNS
jgi:hypothetical protein